MKNTNTSKTWRFDCFDGSITFNFTESVEIRKAFDAMRGTVNEESWLDELGNINSDTDTFDMGCEMYGTSHIQLVSTLSSSSRRRRVPILCWKETAKLE